MDTLFEETLQERVKRAQLLKYVTVVDINCIYEIIYIVGNYIFGPTHIQLVCINQESDFSGTSTLILPKFYLFILGDANNSEHNEQQWTATYFQGLKALRHYVSLKVTQQMQAL